MQNYHKFWQVFCLVSILISINFAQGDPNSGRLAATVGHVSKSGNFAISLPIDVTAQRQITPSEGIRGGIQYFWRNTDGEFFVSFYDNTAKPVDAKQELEQMRENFVSGIIKNGGKFLEKKSLTLSNHIGLEFRTSLITKEVVIIRYYSVEKRIYILSTRLNQNETGEKQLKILDSFKLINDKPKS